MTNGSSGLQCTSPIMVCYRRASSYRSLQTATHWHSRIRLFRPRALCCRLASNMVEWHGAPTLGRSKSLDVGHSGRILSSHGIRSSGRWMLKGCYGCGTRLSGVCSCRHIDQSCVKILPMHLSSCLKLKTKCRQYSDLCSVSCFSFIVNWKYSLCEHMVSNVILWAIVDASSNEMRIG